MTTLLAAGTLKSPLLTEGSATAARYSKVGATEGNVLTGQNHVMGLNAMNTAGVYRVPYKTVTAASDLRLLFSNLNFQSAANGAGDLDNGADITITAAVELDGTFYRLTFGGQTSRTITIGGSVLSDPLGLDVPAGTWIWVRTYVTGTTWQSNRVNYNWDGAPTTGGGGFTAATDATLVTSGAIADAVAFLYGPSVIYGVSDTPLPHIVAVGDSITAGKLDGNGEGGHISPSKGGGWIERAFDGARAVVNIGRGGETGANFALNANHYRRARFITPGSWIVAAYGRNDLGASGATTSSVQAALITTWLMGPRRGAKVAASTITPETNSTDSWATTANQTVTNAPRETMRVAVNTWLRDGAPMLNGSAVAVGSNTTGTVRIGQTGHPVSLLLEVADAVETARNSGIWKAGYAKDGLHPKGTGYAAMAAAVNPALFV